MPEPKDPSVTVIKVTTDNPKHSYYVHFDRDGHDLLSVWEYKEIYSPLMGLMARRTKDVVTSARTKIETPEGAKA